MRHIVTLQQRLTNHQQGPNQAQSAGAPWKLRNTSTYLKKKLVEKGEKEGGSNGDEEGGGK